MVRYRSGLLCLLPSLGLTTGCSSFCSHSQGLLDRLCGGRDCCACTPCCTPCCDPCASVCNGAIATTGGPVLLSPGVPGVPGVNPTLQQPTPFAPATQPPPQQPGTRLVPQAQPVPTNPSHVRR